MVWDRKLKIRAGVSVTLHHDVSHLPRVPYTVDSPSLGTSLVAFLSAVGALLVAPRSIREQYGATRFGTPTYVVYLHIRSLYQASIYEATTRKKQTRARDLGRESNVP